MTRDAAAMTPRARRDTHSNTRRVSRFAACALAAFGCCSFAALVKPTHAFEIDLVHRGEGAYDDMKCVSEEIHANAVVLFSFETTMPGDTVSVKLFDAKGKVVYEEQESSGATQGFTTTAEGDHRACFYKPEASSIKDGEAKRLELAKHRVRVDWKHGVAASEWKKLAKATDLDAFTRTLRELEADLREVHDGMLNLRSIEAEMRDLNEATNTKVAVMSVISLSVCVGMCVWQIVYLKGFFERKKLL